MTVLPVLLTTFTNYSPISKDRQELYLSGTSSSPAILRASGQSLEEMVRQKKLNIYMNLSWFI